MKRGKEVVVAWMLILLPLCSSAQNASAPPLVLSHTFELPNDVKGNFDHLALDPRGDRLFLTPEEYKAVLVLNATSGKVVHVITGIGVPHAVLYREDINRIYVTDGEPGEVRIFDGTTYKPVKNIKLLAHTDSVAFDPVSKNLYVITGGKQAQQEKSIIAVLNTTTGEIGGRIELEGDALEAMALAPASSRLFVNNTALNRIDVVDTQQGRLIASWPITLATKNTSLAIDEKDHLLFVGCRSGAIVVFDANTGKEITSSPMATGVDDMVFDPATRRIYASCGGGGGNIDIYVEDQGKVRPLAQVHSGPMGKTSLLSKRKAEYFVSVPQHDTANASVLVYNVR